MKTTMKAMAMVTMLLIAVCAFASTTKDFPNAGFSASSTGTDVLPDDIYMTSLCIQTECTGYLPCVVIRFSDEANIKNRRYQFYVVRPDGHETVRYHIFEAGCYIADYELLDGEQFLLRTSDGSESIYISSSGQIYRVRATEDDIRFKEYADYGYYACTATGDDLPIKIETIQACIKGNCSGPVDCAMLTFKDKDKLSEMGYEVYSLTPEGRESLGYWSQESGILVTDEVLNNTNSIMLKSADQKHEIYLCRITSSMRDRIPFKV